MDGGEVVGTAAKGGKSTAIEDVKSVFQLDIELQEVGGCVSFPL